MKPPHRKRLAPFAEALPKIDDRPSLANGKDLEMNRWKNELMLLVKMCEATRHIQGHNGSKHIQQGGWETLFVGLQNLRVIGITLGVSSNTGPTWPCSQLSPSIEPNLASSRSAIKVNVLTASVDGLLAMREASQLCCIMQSCRITIVTIAWHGTSLPPLLCSSCSP